MKIGQLTEHKGEDKREFRGHLNTLGITLDIRLDESVIDSPNAPHFVIRSKTKDGRECEIGAAWLKVPSRYESPCPEFLSMTIDDPSFPHPLNVAAFPKVEGHWDITWRRRQEKKAS